MFHKYTLIISGLLTLAQAFTFTVTVGIDETNGHQGLGFDPSTIVPAAGDTIVFTFAIPAYIKNPPSVQHSATQSTFDAPCTPKPGGFDTGVQSTGSANDGTGASFSLVVNDTQPLWFSSSVGNDCKSGMVLSVNPPTTGDMTAAAFRQNAMSSSGPPPSQPASSGSASATDSTVSTSQASSASSPSDSSTAQPKSNASVMLSGRSAGVAAAALALSIGAFVVHM